MPPSLPQLPTPLQTTRRSFRPLFPAATWPVILCVLTGLLTGHTTLACGRVSALCATVRWQPRDDFFRHTRWSRAAGLAATTAAESRPGPNRRQSKCRRNCER